MDQSASTNQSSGSTSAQASTGSTQSSASSGGSTSSDAAVASSDKEKHGKARGHDEDKLTGLDRADQVAGEHGKHGRDNAREKQGGQ
jgi:hypothetical protein